MDNDERATMDRVLVYSDGHGRTKTQPWFTTLPAPVEVEVNGTMFHLVADSKVVDATDAMQARVRAWNAKLHGRAA